MADAPQQPTAAPAPAPEANAPEAAEPSLHPAEIRRIQRQAREVAKELEQMKAERQAAQDAQLSEVDRLKKQLAEYETHKSRAETLTGFVSSTAAELLASLPDAAKAEAAESIEGLDPLAQVKLLRTFAKLSAASAPKDPPKASPGARGPLAPGPMSPEDIVASPERFRASTTPEERRKLLASLSIPGTRK